MENIARRLISMCRKEKTSQDQEARIKNIYQFSFISSSQVDCVLK